MDDVTPAATPIALRRMLWVGLGNPVNRVEKWCPARLSQIDFCFTQAANYSTARPMYRAVWPNTVDYEISIFLSLHKGHHKLPGIVHATPSDIGR